jgi:serine/threonine protein kinase/predicted Zn-dependent protease
MADPLPQLRDIFCAAMERKTPQEQADYLDQACQGRPELRARVEALLRANAEAVDFLQEPAPPEGTAASVREGPGTVIGPYKLLEQIGEGGCGVVFVAEQTQPVRRKVALKVLKPGMDTRQVVARFEAERQALALMDHPNIAKVFDGGETPTGRPYFVMELVNGVPITEFCDHNQLALATRLELFVQVGQAVQHAHHKGIIHRDIKPSNVLVTPHDGAAAVKIIDFGIAKATGQPLTDKTLFTTIAQVIGTPLYMSPEQAALRGLDVDTRSDIYSLGVLLYELLTGTTPFTKARFHDAGYDEIRRIIREEEPPTPSTRLSEAKDTLPSVSARRHTEPARLRKLVGGELDWIVMKALEKDRERRYETASAFMADVQRYLHDEPVTARAPSAWYRARKYARRHRGKLLMVGLGLAALILAVAAVAGSIGWAARDQAAREAALDRQVDLIQDEVVLLLQSGNWPVALASAERAEKLLDAGGRTQLPARLLVLRRDAVMAQRLEDIYNQPAGPYPVNGGPEDSQYARPDDRAYSEAFAGYGLDLAVMPTPEAAQRIAASNIRLDLARALDVWSAVRRRARTSARPGWQELLELAKAVDADDWRQQLRSALVRDDRNALQALAVAADVKHLPAATVSLLARALADYLGATDQAVALLQEAQRQYPGDLWINSALGWYCYSAVRPPLLDEAARYYTASLVIRPSSAYLRNCLGRCLLAQGSLKEALAEFAKATELKPMYPAPWFNRGVIYARMGEWDRALAACHEAIRLMPDHPEAHYSLGTVLRLQGKLPEAAIAFEKAIRLKPDSRVYHTSLNAVRQLQGKPPASGAGYHNLRFLETLKAEDTVDVSRVPPPPGAVALFDGKDLAGWMNRSGGPATWLLLEGGITEADSSNIVTKQTYAGAFTLHVEFRVPYLPDAQGQARGNSGVYVQGRYEVQILDSYGLKNTVVSCGSIFGIAAPQVNACKAPTIWQSYDIEFQSPTRTDGKKTAPAVITVYHNGIKIHDGVRLPADNTPEGLGGDPCTPGPIMLQGRGHPVQYRNIWLARSPQTTR